MGLSLLLGWLRKSFLYLVLNECKELMVWYRVILTAVARIGYKCYSRSKSNHPLMEELRMTLSNCVPPSFH